MATIDAAVAGVTVNSGSTVAQAITSNATGNRAAIVLAIQRNGGGSFSLFTGTCVYGAVSMTLVGATNLGTNFNVYVFKLANPPTGTQTVTFTCASNTGSMNLWILTATGVDQTNIVGGYTTATGTATTATVTPSNVGVGDIVCSIHGSDTAGAGFSSGGQGTNEVSRLLDNTGSTLDVAGASRLGPFGSGAMTYTVTAGNYGAAVAQLLNFNPGARLNSQGSLAPQREAMQRAAVWMRKWKQERHSRIFVPDGAFAI